MIDSDYIEIGQSPTKEKFEAGLIDFAHRLEFDLVHAMLVVEVSPTESRFVSLGNMPAAFAEASGNEGDCKRDPVFQQLKRLSTPVIFDQSTYVSEGAGDLWEQQAQFGYHTGIAMALHLPQSRHFLLGVDRRKALPRRSAQLTKTIAQLQLFAVYAQEAAQRLLVGSLTAGAGPDLTGREREVLRWTMEGKSNWSISQLMGVSEHTVSFHIRNAMAKLQCSSKHMAVARALRLGLI